MEGQVLSLPIDKDTVKLLRIPFSYFLMPVYFFALSQAHDINWQHAILCFITLHLFIYPASNGYNSYMDQDETSIGGLENPPKATHRLFYLTILFDIIGVTIAWFVNLYFFVGVLGYMLASRSYSYKGIRLKTHPLLGFITVVVFQGAVTFCMIYDGVNNTPMHLNLHSIAVLAASTLLIGGIYPLTQVYQHEADKAGGDVTISRVLGIKGTFVFSAVMFAWADSAFYFYFNSIHHVSHFFLLQACLLPVTIYFAIWFLLVLADEKAASFRHTMLMNTIAATCMNCCFILMILINPTL